MAGGACSWANVFLKKTPEKCLNAAARFGLGLGLVQHGAVRRGRILTGGGYQPAWAAAGWRGRLAGQAGVREAARLGAGLPSRPEVDRARRMHLGLGVGLGLGLALGLGLG